MNKILFLVIALILFACAPQVTATSDVTVTLTPPPTETPIPTPTFHPDFITLQNLINASSENFTLLPDGTIEEVTADGGRQTVPDVHIDQNGIINIIFNNEHVLIEPSQITFDDENGITIDGYELTAKGWSEAYPMTPADQEIWDAAPEVEGCKKAMSETWGVVCKDANGEVAHYWDYNEYNHARGTWVEVERVDGERLILAGGEIVYPERFEVDGIQFNATARNHKENKMPETPEEFLAHGEALLKAMEQGLIAPLAEDAITLRDMVMRNSFNPNGIVREMFLIPYEQLVERSPGEIPYSPVVYPYIGEDGKVVEGVGLVPVLVKQTDGTTSYYWSLAVNYDNRLPYLEQQLLDGNEFSRGGNAMLTPLEYKNEAACHRMTSNNPALTDVCATQWANREATRRAFTSSVASGMVNAKLKDGTYLPFGVMASVAK